MKFEENKWMAILDRNIPFIKLLFNNTVRISLVFERVENSDRVEYLFAQDMKRRSSITNDPNRDIIFCMMYSGTMEDPLKLYGSNCEFEKFAELVINPAKTYRIVSIIAYPPNWYSCFETDKDRRIQDLRINIEEWRMDHNLIKEMTKKLSLKRERETRQETIHDMNAKRKLLYD